MAARDHGYGLISLGFGAVMSVLGLKLGQYPTLQAVLLYGGAPLFLIGVGLLLPWRGSRNLWARISQYEVVWPFRRKLGWPHVVPLAGRIHHVRSFVDFSSLETERTFQVTLKLLNSSVCNLKIESVYGHTEHDGMGGSQPLDIAWKATSTAVVPLSEFEIVFDQRVPSEAVPLMAGLFREGKSLSVSLKHIHVMVRAVETGKGTEARLWDGISCVVSPYPVVIGQIVTAEAHINMGWSGSKAQP
jgi:hypothetical protein